MTATKTPPQPPVIEAPSEFESKPRRPWWRRLLVVILIVIGLGVVSIFWASRDTSDGCEQFIEDMQENAGLSESDAEQMIDELEPLVDDPTIWENVSPNDGYVSDDEIVVIRAGYTAFVTTEPGQIAGLPDDSTFTDEQIRALTDEVCEHTFAAESLAELQARWNQAFKDEPNPAAAGAMGGAGAAYACMSAGERLGVYG